MNWITASLLMFVCSVGTYLCIRLSNSYRTPQQFNNLAMFAIPVAVYLMIAKGADLGYPLGFWEIILILIQSIFFSYIGNVFSLRAIEYAPNPGYSLMLSKSYVVMTSILSIFLFGSPLGIKSVIAIVLIVMFSALIMIDPHKKSGTANPLWLPLTIGAFLCWGSLALSTKYLLNIGVPIFTRLIFSMTLVTFLIMGETAVKRVKYRSLSRKQYAVLILVGIFSAGFNYYMQVGMNLAPNVGYVNAANAGSISLLTLLSALLFKDDLNMRKMSGIIGVTIGLIILFI